jgi:hypothetical protein
MRKRRGRRRRTTLSGIDELKREVFFRLLESAGRVFLLVGYSKDVRIGRRGFLPEEKKNGLVLVFNSSMKFSWEDGCLKATLAFGSAPEKCRIPIENITAIYAPEIGAQFVVSPVAEERGKGASAKTGKGKRIRDDKNLIEVDFGKVRQDG